MGEHRLKDLKEPEHIFQLLAPDLPSEFPPLKTMDAPSEDDRYRLIRQIGSGGMAEVYLAYDEGLEREVAFKVLDRKQAENREAVERFRREARNAASLSHTEHSLHPRSWPHRGRHLLLGHGVHGRGHPGGPHPAGGTFDPAKSNRDRPAGSPGSARGPREGRDPPRHKAPEHTP